MVIFSRSASSRIAGGPAERAPGPSPDCAGATGPARSPRFSGYGSAPAACDGPCAVCARALFWAMSSLSWIGAENCTRLAPQHQDAEQLAQAPGDRPAVGEQQLPGAGLAIRRLAPEHADRNDLRVLYRVVLQRADQPHQRRWRDRRVRRPNQLGAGLRKKKAAGSTSSPTATSATGRGSPACCTRHRARRDRSARLLQHIEHRLAAIQLEGEGGLVDGLRAHPGVQHTAHQEKIRRRTGSGSYGGFDCGRGGALEGGKCAPRGGRAKPALLGLGRSDRQLPGSLPAMAR